MTDGFFKYVRVALPLLMTACGLVACQGSAEDAPPDVSAAEAAVVVVNGAGRADVCGALAAKLGVDAADGVEGYRNGDGELDYSVRETLIRCDARNKEQAEAVRDALGFGTFSYESGLDKIEVIVGWDAPPPEFDKPPADGVYVDTSEKAVYFFRGGQVAEIWPCATGKAETPTPAGRYEVTVTVEKPTWYWQGKAIPPGPENGLGDWFIGISKKGYGLHGTNEPPSIGTAASHGCVRMYNDDAGELVKSVSAGTPVVIVE